MSAARWPGEDLVPAICPRCETQRGPVSTFIAAQIERSGCAGCFAAYADELSDGPRARAVRLGIHLVGDSEEPASSSSTSIEEPKQEAIAGQAPASPDLTEGEAMDQQTENRLEEVLIAHASVAKAAEEVGCSKEEAADLRDILREDGITCRCGRKLCHRGVCRRVPDEAGQADPSQDEDATAPASPARIYLSVLDDQERVARDRIEQAERELAAIAEARASVSRLEELAVQVEFGTWDP